MTIPIKFRMRVDRLEKRLDGLEARLAADWGCRADLLEMLETTKNNLDALARRLLKEQEG